MIRRPTRSTRTDTPCPCTPLCRSAVEPTARVGDLAHHLPVRAHRGAVARQGRTCEIARLARPAVDRILAHILAVEGEQRVADRDRKSTRLNSSHYCASRMPSSA